MQSAKVIAEIARDSLSNNPVFQQIVNLIVGFIASLLVWLVLTKIFRPRIAMSNVILMVPSVFDGSKSIAKIKMENTSCFDVYELNLRGRIFLYGLIDGDPDTPVLFVITVGNGSHPYLPNKRKSNKEAISGRVFRLVISKSTRSNIAALIPNLPPNHSPTLKDMLGMDKRNYIEICAFCSHGFSLTRGFCERTYELKDIKNGIFNNHGLCFHENLPKDVRDLHSMKEIDEMEIDDQ